METGCPAGYQTLTLELLASQGPYVLPFTLDEAGNDDGVICGKPFNEVAYEKLCKPCPVPVLYQFRDNDLTPAH